MMHTGMIISGRRVKWSRLDLTAILPPMVAVSTIAIRHVILPRLARNQYMAVLTGLGRRIRLKLVILFLLCDVAVNLGIVNWIIQVDHADRRVKG